MSKFLKSFSLLITLLFVLSCTTKQTGVELNFEQYTLSNGLKVVLHQDHSDPIVSLAIQYHVGSGREKPGRTGFAHFFEHMLFQRSENLPRNAFFQKIARMGGTFNGSTNTDGTNYYEAVPRDALEKILWMESDRMGFFINTVTQSGLEREIDIVSNEKRQNYDSQPYGQSSIIIAKELYPQGHPYSWTTIGEIEDLRNATLEDVKEFYHKYYVPSNATLVLAGDFDKTQAKELIEKYFGEIVNNHQVERPAITPVELQETKKVMWEDAYAKLPMINISYPTVEQYNKDSYALSAFTSLFAAGKSSPLYKVLVEEKKLAPAVNAFNISREIAGHTQISVRTFEGVDLNEVYSAIEEAFARFESEGVNESELEKFKVIQEVSMYSRMSGIMGKAIMMARDNEFGGSPDRSLTDLQMIMKISAKDVMRVYDKYFKGRPHLVLSMVPAGKGNLAVADSRMAEVTIEKVEDQQMKSQGGKIVDDEYERTPSSFDRSVEPEFLPNTPEVKLPEIWKMALANGMEMYGITNNELPLVQFTITIKGGMLLDPAGKEGLSYLNARLMNEGTELKSAEELESAMGLLGARINISSDNESTNINVTALSRNFKEVLALTEEMILKPRFDEAALARIKQETKASIRQSTSDPRSIAVKTRNRLLYGEDGTFAKSYLGTPESIDAITIEDIKAFYKANMVPNHASLNVAGKIDAAAAKEITASLVTNWAASELNIPQPVWGIPAKGATIYFVDNPGSPQSMIFVSKRGMSMSHPDFYPATVVNYRLGSGSQGLLFDVLRLQRGFTYGASSGLEAGEHYNNFTASSSVQASTTPEAVTIFRDLIGNYHTQFNAEMLEETRNSLIRSMASSFETLGSLVRVLSNISYYGLPLNYVTQQQEQLNNMTLEQAKEVIARNFNISDMVFVVVGDARTQLKPLESVGLGKPVLVKM